MKEVVVKIINAFAIDGTGGNPAGIVVDADDLSRDKKQIIAARVGLSETAFVSKLSVADFKLEFFTPVKQIAHCGHATIATFTYLRQNGVINGERSSKETIDGNRAIYFRNGAAYMEQTSPSYLNVEHELPYILESLNLSRADLSNHPPAIVNTGNGFLIVPVVSKKVLKDLKPDFELIRKYSIENGLIGYYAFTLSTEDNISAHARMFAPLYGIDEEAATGMAAGPLACYLFDNNINRKIEMAFRQGEYMATPSPSLIHVNLVIENNKIGKLYAGGDAFVSREKIITLE